MELFFGGGVGLSGGLTLRSSLPLPPCRQGPDPSLSTKVPHLMNVSKQVRVIYSNGGTQYHRLAGRKPRKIRRDHVNHNTTTEGPLTYYNLLPKIHYLKSSIGIPLH